MRVLSGLGAEIRERRTQQNLKQEDLAEQLDVSQAFISRLENDEVPTLSELLLEKLNGIMGDLPQEYFSSDDRRKKKVSTPIGVCVNIECALHPFTGNFYTLPASESDGENLYCDRCGRKLVFHCSNCGRPISKADQRFCRQCGAKMPFDMDALLSKRQEQRAQRKAQKEKSSREAFSRLKKKAGVEEKVEDSEGKN